jgi:hypothetical protein
MCPIAARGVESGTLSLLTDSCSHSYDTQGHEPTDGVKYGNG